MLMRAVSAMVVALLAPIAAQGQDAAPPGDFHDLPIAAKIPRGGDFMAFGFDSLWIMSDLRLARINPDDNSVIDIEVEGTVGRYRGIAIGEGAVWIPDVGADTIYKVDPKTNKVTAAIAAQMLASEGSIAAAAGSLWVALDQEEHRSLSRINAQSGETEARIALPGDGAGVEAAFGSVWVTAPLENELYRIDQETNAVVATIPLAELPRFLAADADSIWVFNQGGTVQRVDGHTGKLVATIETGLVGRGGDIAVGGGFIWVTSRLVALMQIDPKSNVVVAKFRSLSVGDAVRYGAGSVWISGPFVHRINVPM